MRSKALCFGLFIVFGVVSEAQVPSVRTVAVGNSGTAFVGQVVTGAPYSAQQVIEHTQTLADGTHINQKPQITQIYRDAQGRTRTERPVFTGANSQSGESPVIVEIKDAVAGFQYTLDMQAHVAHRVALTSPPGMAKQQEAAGTGVPRAVISQMPSGRAASTPGVSSGGGGSVWFTSSGYSGPEQIKHTSESLGTQTIEGVLVQGHKTTITIPAGAEGNDQPMVITTEMWDAPDLKVTVLLKSNDPRSGERVTRLQNITAGDPDASLFAPPSDFTIVDENGPFQIQYQLPPAQGK
ncbi:MAG: hypothetical protein JO108_08990 [Acidobacteriaceae bacterium]|nr:hypothetical protein [Acidobacteriaceae bacterium]